MSPMSNEKKYAGFDDETRTPQSQGGRPGKTAGAGIPEFVADKVLKIYVSFLREQAPKSWSGRQLNHHIFGHVEKPLTKKSSVTNGLGHLLARRSIPLLTSGQVLSEGILRAERDPRFLGGLQILYHPYVLALAGKHDLPTLHALLCLIPLATTSGLFHATVGGLTRALQPVEAEIDILTAAAQGIGAPEASTSKFPDGIACALLLAQEAAAIGDRKRLRRWQRWFRKRELAFENWRVGDVSPRKALDRWVDLYIESLQVESVDPWSTGFEYLAKHVFTVELLRESQGEAQRPEVTGSVHDFGELSGVLESLLHGQQPPRSSRSS